MVPQILPTHIALLGSRATKRLLTPSHDRRSGAGQAVWARGSDADRRAKLLIYRAAEGSMDAY